MIRNFRMLAVILIALGAIGIGLRPVLADPVQVPFDASYSGTISLTDNQYVILFSGAGISSHLGLGANQGQIVITGMDNSCSGGVANTNYERLTAANGDSLFLTSYDVACPIGSNVYRGGGNWTVTGGTGRFSRATGHGTLDGQSDFNQFVFTIHLTGVISGF
jgi:hypothetical protein